MQFRPGERACCGTWSPGTAMGSRGKGQHVRQQSDGSTDDRAFSSFPDTSLFAEGTTTFSFRLRHTPPDPDEPDPLSPGLEIGGQSAEGINGAMSVSQSLPAITKSERSDEYRQWDELGGQWLYGYVWFEQRKDESVARGYMQVSLYRDIADSKEIPSVSNAEAVAFSVPYCIAQNRASVFCSWLRLSRGCLS